MRSGAELARQLAAAGKEVEAAQTEARQLRDALGAARAERLTALSAARDAARQRDSNRASSLCSPVVHVVSTHRTCDGCRLQARQRDVAREHVEALETAAPY